MAVRRKLFSNPTVNKTRRKLFSDDECGMQSSVLVCSDCKTAYRYPDGKCDGSTNFICPRCGGHRFEILKNLKTPQSRNGITKDPSVDKVFSDTRRKLFSDENGVEKKQSTPYYYCRDCKTAIESDSETPDAVRCPNCGSNHIEVLNASTSKVKEHAIDPAADPARVNEDQDEFVVEQDREDKIISDLINNFRGKIVSDSDILDYVFEKYGVTDYDVDSLIEQGYIEEIDVDPEEAGQPSTTRYLRFRDTASLQNKIFSAVKISITKEFDLDPCMDHESAVEILGERLPEEGVTILRRISSNSHPERVVHFSESDYLVDSGISNDMKAEYGGSSMGIKEFMSILERDYPDAPENIMDLLSQDGVISISGGQVNISK